MPTNEKDGKIKAPISKTCTSFSSAYFDIILRRFLLCTATLYFFAFTLTFFSQLLFSSLSLWRPIYIRFTYHFL
ncbi:unnamed protein product [Cunninghamella blakesleeana]